MLLEEAGSFSDIFRGIVPFYIFVALPIFIILAPVSPVLASHEFNVYRMQQYDLHTIPHGCRSANINLEGRSLTSWSTSRHCVVARVQDITIDQFINIRAKAGALLLVLPKNITLLTDEEKEHIQLLEMAMTQQEITAPVYFIDWTQEIEEIVADLGHSFITDDKSGTALEAMINGISSNGYQFVVSTSNPPKVESRVVSLHGKLVGAGSAQTIVVQAHYDSAGIVPELSFGSDSNASGAVALLELARIFSRIYSSSATRGSPTILFLLTGTGNTLNYFSAKKWLEDQLDGTEATLLQDISFIMSLDSISSSPSLKLHVSKPPKPGTASYSLQTRLDLPVLHKKINLADEVLAWEHERFSIRRLPSFTLSACQSHKDPSRSSVLDVPTPQAVENLIANIQNIARGLASHIYNLTDEDETENDAKLYDDLLNVDEESIKLWYNYLTNQSRAQQIINIGTGTVSTGVAASLERVLTRYLGEVTVTSHVPDKREPEFALYGITRSILNVYSVKPAVFDLLLTLAIVAYLTVVYFALYYFPHFYSLRITTNKNKVQ